MDTDAAWPAQDVATVRRLRRGTGILGMALPFVLTIGNALFAHRFVLLGTISAAYYTPMRSVLVGGLCSIGVFLICYRYDRRDDALSTLAGALAIVVALFPTTPSNPTTGPTSTDVAIGWVHYVAAAGLFVVLAYFCIFLFTRTDFTRTDPTATRLTARKRIRNRIYYACGGIIVGSLALAAASSALPTSVRATVKPLFWCEAIAVLAFGAAWLVKGQTIFRDQEPVGDRAGPIDAPCPLTTQPG